jgi:hypothetical protein
MDILVQGYITLWFKTWLVVVQYNGILKLADKGIEGSVIEQGHKM